MKITRISQQVKRSDRYSLYVDDKYAFSLSEAAPIKSGLVSGQEITAAELDEYKLISADDKAYNQALRYVVMRPRSEWELKNYLLRKGQSEAFTEQTIKRLKDLKLIDDAIYAVNFVRDRELLKPTSRRKLILELKKKRVPEECISAALADESINEQANLRQVIAKKRRQTKYQDDTKLMQYLARQGFGYNDIKTALLYEANN